MKRFVFLSMSLLALVLIIPGCFTAQPTETKAPVVTPSVISPVSSEVVTTPPSATPVPFAVTGVEFLAEPANFTGSCPKTFTFYATIHANGPGTVTYIWESYDKNGQKNQYSDDQTVTFTEAGAKTTTLQWDLRDSASGIQRIHVLSPNGWVSTPVYYELNCNSGSLVTGVVVGIDQFPFTGSCPKTVNFWGDITASGPGTVTYRWDRSDGSTFPATITFTAAGTQKVTNAWTIQSESIGWQRLHILTPYDAVSSQLDFNITCDKSQ